MESNEAGGESGHMTAKQHEEEEISRHILRHLPSTLGSSKGTDMEMRVSLRECSKEERQTLALMIMCKNDNQTQTPPLISHVILSEAAQLISYIISKQVVYL